jgi:HTH-type transcriptional regulator, transcriptional repressor of NAD biosynthesis genes
MGYGGGANNGNHSNSRYLASLSDCNAHMKSFKLGLVVGKFSPLHLGHQFLIDAAANQSERLLILSYSKPEFSGCFAAQRRRWLEKLYPNHDIVVIDDSWLREFSNSRGLLVNPIPENDSEDSLHQKYLAYLLRDVLQKKPDAIFANENYVEPTAELLSKELAHKVVPVKLDPTRSQIPISATQIRAEPVNCWRYLHSAVRTSMVQRVVLLGGESTGKTTLAQALATALGTQWVPEFGRELWEQQAGQLNAADLRLIANEQCAREDQLAAETGPWLICDTSPLTTLGYSEWMFGHRDPAIEILASRHYTLTVVCVGDFPFHQDGTRRDVVFQQMQHQWYLAELVKQNISWLEARGDIRQRVATVMNAIQHPTEQTIPSSGV